jgi:hypothetical protein
MLRKAFHLNNKVGVLNGKKGSTEFYRAILAIRILDFAGFWVNRETNIAIFIENEAGGR